MDVRHAYFIEPSERRLRHLFALAVRNVGVEGGAAIPPPLWYRLLTEDDTELYRSEVVPHTCNPTWAPMEWPQPPLNTHTPSHTADDWQPHLLDAVLHCHTVRVQVCAVDASYAYLHLHSRGHMLPANAERSEDALLSCDDDWADLDAYFDDDVPDVGHQHALSSAGARAHTLLQHSSPVLDLVVDLRTLVHAGFNVMDALAQVSTNMQTPSKGGSVAGGLVTVPVPPMVAGAVAGHPSGSATFACDSLPLNFCVFTLDDGQCLLPSTARALRLDGAAPVPSPSTFMYPTAAGGLVGDKMLLRAGEEIYVYDSSSSAAGKAVGNSLHLDYMIEGLGQLVACRHDVLKLEAESARALTDIKAVLRGTDSATSSAMKCKLVDKAARVEELRRLRDTLAAQVAAEEARAAATHDAMVVEAVAVRNGLHRLAAAVDLTRPMQEEVDKVQSEIGLLKNLISAKQLSLLADLRALYPISKAEREGVYTIRNLELPDKDITSHQEEQVSTALGYLVHTVALMSKYLRVPLRFYPRFMASRSAMTDEAGGAVLAYPLYWKGVDLAAFHTALSMLRRDIRQLLHSQGITCTEPSMLAQLLRLYAVLLDEPLATSTLFSHETHSHSVTSS